MMPLSVKKVNLITASLRIDHSIFSEMIIWPFPFERISR